METDLGFVKHSCDRAERNKELAAMAQSEPNGLFAMVELNYQGVFNRNPFSYTGGVKTIFNDVDFSSMTYSEFVTFCERFMHEECKKFYYCEPDMSFMEGLNPISDDVEYSAFNGVISVYVDHIGVGVDGWHDDEDNDDDEHESCIDGENEDNIDELRNVAFEFNEDVMHMNRTSNDHFLSKLCVDDEDANNIVDDDNGREVESLKAGHNCARNFKFGSLVTYAWIGSHYTKEIVESQKISVRKLRLKVMAKFGIQVSMGQCRRAKKYTLKLVEGNLVEHYGKLWSYGHEILRTNPGSTVKLDMEDGPDGKKYFSKFYCCFQGVKQGWIEGCRRGELLCAIGRDANDKIYPIAWAVVNVENKQNWKWFLELLIDDQHLNLGNGFSLMSEQHKGLIEAAKELLPYVEHRQCARHIFQNLQKRFTGAIYHTLFWRASKATTEHSFKVVMKEIETLNPEAHQYLMEKDPKTWSRAFFQTGRCCDAVENGFSESFNVVIVDARKKPIITMLEEIRLYMMDKIYNIKLKGQQWGNHICPEIRDKVNFLKKAQRHYQTTCLATTTFRKAYNYRISPMNSSDMWPETNYTPPLPPINRRMPGRPTTKRKKSTTENTGTHRVSKAGKKIRCSICKEIGHNKATCPQRRPQKLNVKKQKKQKEVDEVNPNTQVDNGNVQEVAPVNQVQQVCVRPISDILKRIRRRKSERILKLKLGKTIGGVDDPEISKGKALIRIRGLTTLQHQHIKVDNPNL
uniref:MULE transposase domain-containing protein n=1 Tax=Lactuca sativa TaxID=4236 RepID=A0A9R1V749_LACSA|nr:hypothetical protein LSAT_V11C600338640 [Lactuca sativa]